MYEIFERFRKHKLKVTPDKCSFFRKEVNFLGHVITDNGFYPDESKISAVQNFPIPKNQTDIKSFIGLAGYYRRFIQNFGKIALPLTSLLKKDAPFSWTSTQQEVFENLKSILTSSPLLQFLDISKEFLLTTDASCNFRGGPFSRKS